MGISRQKFITDVSEIFNLVQPSDRAKQKEIEKIKIDKEIEKLKEENKPILAEKEIEKIKMIYNKKDKYHMRMAKILQTSLIFHFLKYPQ